MTEISNFKLNMASMNAFIEKEGGKISDEDSTKLNTIFKECDTEGAQNDKGENIGDGVLNMKEFVNFLKKEKSSCPNIFNKFVAFLTVDKKAQLDEMNNETIRELEKTEAEIEQQKKQIDKVLQFFNNFKDKIDDKTLQEQIKTLNGRTDEKEFNKKLKEFTDANDMNIAMEEAIEDTKL